MSVPAVPSVHSASLDVLRNACVSVAEWAQSCDDIEAAVETLAKVSALETYLSKKGQEFEAQAAARWLEIRIGQLLPEPSPGERSDLLHASKRLPLTAIERHRFRQLAEHADVVAPLIPTSRAKLLAAIKAKQRVLKAQSADDYHADVIEDLDTTEHIFHTVVVDPPWRYDNRATRNAADRVYLEEEGREHTTMSQEELLKLTIPAADDAHLYLWVTNSFIRDGFELMEAWDFKYKTCLTWCKPQIGMGNYFRSTTEHVLFGVRGKQPTLANNVPTHFVSDRMHHSAKPDVFFDLVETCSPGPWLEMFSRHKRRFRWVVWGNEA